MPYVLVQIDVHDFAEFEAIFVGNADRRHQWGSKGGRVFQVTGDPKKCIVLLEWDDADRAQDFIDSPEFRVAAEWAADGLTFKATVLNEVLQSDA
ncbi:MAG: DUF1330 domain-containing protein [Actinobacteria bacterium]|nr:DUF1330 domain-containing protein [Actinomycetota bacterium]